MSPYEASAHDSVRATWRTAICICSCIQPHTAGRSKPLSSSWRGSISVCIVAMAAGVVTVICKGAQLCVQLQNIVSAQQQTSGPIPNTNITQKGHCRYIRCNNVLGLQNQDGTLSSALCVKELSTGHGCQELLHQVLQSATSHASSQHHPEGQLHDVMREILLTRLVRRICRLQRHS